MSAQLLVVKRLFLEAKNFAEQTDPIAAGIAISLLQDAVELYLWTLIKDRNIPIKDNDGFLLYLQKIEEKSGSPVPYKARLLELNKARVNFKHYGNLPAPAEAAKHRDYVEDFLREAMNEDFATNLDLLSLADLITDVETREHLRDAETHMAASDYSEAAAELAMARSIAFRKMGRFMPEVDHHLDDADRAFEAVAHARGRPFQYIRQYLSGLREASLIGMLNLSLEDYGFLVGGLPVAHQALAGNWSVVHRRSNYTEAECRKAITCLVTLCLRLQARP